MEVDEHPLETANELSVTGEPTDAASSHDASNFTSELATGRGEEVHGVTTVDHQMETHPLLQGNQAPASEPTTTSTDCSGLPDVSEAFGSGQITGAPIVATDQRLKVTKEGWNLLETAQVLSEITTPLLPESNALDTERQADPFVEVSDPHVLVLSTVQQENVELQSPEEVILELPNGIKMYGKDLACITELLHPTQVLLQTGPRKFTLATADAVLSAGSLVFTVSQEMSQEEEPLVKKQPDPEVEGKLYRCYLCSLTFNRRGNYVRHKKIHMVNTEDDVRYKCPQCDRQFIQHCDLRRHAHVHTGTQPHKCDLCGKAFLRASDLVVHKRFHSKDRPFQCSQCQKSFFQSGDLRRHVRNIHLTNARMLSCGHCKKKYTKEATLLHHIQTMHQDILLQTLKEQGQHCSEVMVAEAESAAEDESSLSTYRLEHTEMNSVNPVLPSEPGAHEETGFEEAHATQYRPTTHPSVSGQFLETTVPDTSSP